MPIELTCTYCSRALRVGDETAGKQIKCPQCANVLSVPFGSHASGSSQQWRVLTEDGKQFGPVDRNELESWVRDGRLTGRCQVAREGDQQWRWASDVFAELASTGPQPKPGHVVSTTRTHTSSGEVESDRSFVVAVLLGVLLPFFGINGVHRIYTGHIGIGILQLITLGGCYIWQLIDVILLVCGGVRDAEGRKLKM